MDENAPTPTPARSLPRWLAYGLIFGLFLTLRGYHSLDGDQAYRLPLLLHRQDPALFSNDPFVRAFDAFNPHRGYLTLLDLASRPLGLSAGMAALFTLTFGLTCLGLDRMARAVWPEMKPQVGVMAVSLVLVAKAGNIGTNHLFEAMLLDRLIGFALGWVALASSVADPSRGWWAAPPLLGLATLVHPSVGLQLTMLAGAGWVVWAIRGKSAGVSPGQALLGLAALGLAAAPGVAMNVGQGSRLFEGLPEDQFRLLSVTLQGPQHMLPHLWRLPQWAAWICYPLLAIGALRGGVRNEPGAGCGARVRLGLLGGACLAGLAAAWLAIEVVGDLRTTLFQPFRMATVLRGLALVALSGRLLQLWRRGAFEDRGRAALLAIGLAGDRMLVVATLVDAVIGGLAAVGARDALRRSAGAVVLAGGLVFLARHDTESGHVPLIAGLGALALLSWGLRGRRPGWNRRRVVWAAVGCWIVPLAAVVVASTPLSVRPWARGLVERCRFAAIPTDDVERLADWCRTHTPHGARFIGPPGPKTFRLWSRRSMAFNRAASPYHAAGLADWAQRFRAHVGFAGSYEELVAAYLADRHGLERRYQEMTDAERAALAVAQGASYVVAAAPPRVGEAKGDATAAEECPLELLHVEGRYAVYRVREAALISLRDRPEIRR